MKKKLVLASSACLVASAMALGGCSGGSKPAETSAAAEKSEAAADATTAAAEGGSSDAMHLSFYYPVNVGGDAAKLIEKICADFNAENPDIVVDPVYTGNYDDTVTKIQTAIQGGTPPDVFVSLATQRFTMASTGMAMPLDDLIAAEIWRVLNDNIQSAVTGDATAEEALSAAQEQATEVLSEYQ